MDKTTITFPLINYEAITKPEIGEPGMVVSMKQEAAISLIHEIWQQLDTSGEEWVLSLINAKRR